MKNFIRNFKHYFKVYRVFLRLNLNTLFAYRANFINSVVANTVWAIFIIVSMLLLTSKTSHVFGWTRDELLILAGTYNIIFSIFYFFFSRNFSEFSNIIHFGRLDSILIKPIDSQYLMTFTNVSYTHIIRFSLGVGFVIYVLSQMHAAITLISIILFIVFLILSVIILYSIWMIIITVTIWYTKLSNLVEFLYEAHNVSKYPQEIYLKASVFILLAVFPLTLVVVNPAKALINKLSWSDFFWSGIFAVVLFVIARKFWRFALRFYTSASG